MDRLSLFPAILPPHNPGAAQHQDEVVQSLPIYVNRPLMTDAQIERALEQELAA